MEAFASGQALGRPEKDTHLPQQEGWGRRREEGATAEARQYLCGKRKLSPHVLVGLHQLLVTPERVRQAIATREGGAGESVHGELGPHPAHQGVPGEALHHGLHQGHLALHAVEHAAEAALKTGTLERAVDLLSHLPRDAQPVSPLASAARRLVSDALRPKGLRQAMKAMLGESAHWLGGSLGLGRGALKTVKGAAGALSHGLVGLGAGVAAYQGYHDGERSTAGRLANGALSAGADLLLATHPALHLADAVLPAQVSPGRHLQGSVKWIPALGELLHGSVAASDRFLERAQAGEYGWLFQRGTELGELLFPDRRAETPAIARGGVP